MSPFQRDLTSRLQHLIVEKNDTLIPDLATITWAFSEKVLEDDYLLVLLAKKLEGLSKVRERVSIWLDLIKKNPLKYTFSDYLADSINNDCEQETKNQIKTAIQSLYTQIPDKNFVSKLLENGINPRGALGVFNKCVQGWILIPSGQMPRIEFWFTDKLPLELYRHYTIKNYDLLSIKIKIPEEVSFASVRLIEKNVGDYPGSPIFIDAPERVKFALNTAEETNTKKRDRVTVILPVYENRDGTLACIESLFESQKYCKTPFDILIIYDGGSDKILYEKLLKLHVDGKIKLLTLDTNRGFISAVNEGLINTEDGDCVILTSDTLVHGDWLDRLKDTAYISKKIGIVCPLTNKGEFFSYPKNSKDELNPSSLSKIDELCKNIFSREDVINIPLAIGFCAYIKKELLKKIGGLNGKILYRGYGEDVEFSFRARKAGYKIALSPNVFVYHKGCQSFNEIQKALFAHQNNKAIEELYPKYRENYLKYLSTDPISKIRKKISLNLISPLKYLIMLPLIDRADPFFDLIIDIAREQKIDLGFLIVSEEGNVTIVFKYHNDLQIDPINLVLPNDAKIIRKILAKAELNNIVLYGYNSFLIDLTEDLNINKQLLIGHLTPDFLDLIDTGSLKKKFKNFSDIFVFSERMYKFLYHITPKTKYFPLINQKIHNELYKTHNHIKSSIPKLKGENLPSNTSIIVTTPYDFNHFKEFVSFTEENRDVCFFVNRLELWDGVRLKDNVFPYFEDVLFNQQTKTLVNLIGILLWHDDPEEEFIYQRISERRGLKLFKYEIQKAKYPW